MESKHTSGPWGLDLVPEYETGTDPEVLDKDGFPVATIEAMPLINRWAERFPGMRHWADGEKDGRTVRERPRIEYEANAHLIAAAPDLLSALDRLLNTHQGISIKELKEAIDAGHAAIAKARGERSR